MQRTHGIFAVVTVLILMIGAGTAQAQDDVAVTTVNGQPIMASELEDELIRRWGDIGLAALIQELAVEQAAQNAGISVTPEEVDERRDMFQGNIDARSGAPVQGFAQWLAQQKMTPYAFRQWIRTELLLEKLIGSAADVPEEEVAAFYQGHQEQFQQPERMRVSHICVNDKAEAARIRKEILDGKPFEQAAREYSTDPYTRDQGGAFGVITRGNTPFQNAAFALTGDKQMTEPVQTQMGWHIIRREEYLPASTPTYDEVKEQIKDQMESQKLLVLIGQKRAEIMQNARIEHQIDPEQLIGN